MFGVTSAIAGACAAEVEPTAAPAPSPQPPSPTAAHPDSGRPTRSVQDGRKDVTPTPGEHLQRLFALEERLRGFGINARASYLATDTSDRPITVKLPLADHITDGLNIRNLPRKSGRYLGGFLVGESVPAEILLEVVTDGTVEFWVAYPIGTVGAKPGIVDAVDAMRREAEEGTPPPAVFINGLGGMYAFSAASIGKKEFLQLPPGILPTPTPTPAG